MKHLQKEVARLEAERRTPGPSTEKDFKIQQVSNSIYFSFVQTAKEYKMNKRFDA